MTLHHLTAAPPHSPPPEPARWEPDALARLEGNAHDEAPVITRGDIAPIAPAIDIWDAWPIQTTDGAPAAWDEGRTTLWMALAAPRFPDPDMRHAHARIHLVARRAGGWRWLGPAMPDGFSPGSREWSGSAVLEGDGRTVTLYFTAAGQRGEEAPGFLQRLHVATATLAGRGGSYRLLDWRALREIVAPDPAWYMPTDRSEGAAGTIKAFRDPAYFRDPADGRDYLFFAGSHARSPSAFNGVIGACARDGGSWGGGSGSGEWRLLPPIVSADGLNNELERPHVVRHAGLYYLFWSTQRHVFDPAGPAGPTGLYGMVSDRMSGGWAALNGTGLVFANPAVAPRQAYSWWVMPDLSVTSFVDDWGDTREDGGERRFGGCFAPFLHLWLDGARAGLLR